MRQEAVREARNAMMWRGAAMGTGSGDYLLARRALATMLADSPQERDRREGLGIAQEQLNLARTRERPDNAAIIEQLLLSGRIQLSLSMVDEAERSGREAWELEQRHISQNGGIAGKYRRGPACQTPGR